MLALEGGLKKARMLGIEQAAIMLIKKNFDVELICEVTNLPREKVEKLKQKILCVK